MTIILCDQCKKEHVMPHVRYREEFARWLCDPCYSDAHSEVKMARLLLEAEVEELEQHLRTLLRKIEERMPAALLRRADGTYDIRYKWGALADHFVHTLALLHNFDFGTTEVPDDEEDEDEADRSD